MIADEGVPVGFEMEENLYEFPISYRSRGTGRMILFLVVCVGSVMAGLSVVALRDWESFEAVLFATWWTPLAFAAGIAPYVYFAFFALWLLFGRMEFLASPEGLIVQKKLFGLQREQQIPREFIKDFGQVKDGGEGEDTFPSWGLNVGAEREIPLLGHQPVQKSDWLGRVLSRYYQVEFRPCENRT